MFFKEEMRPSIVSLKGEPPISKCGICGSITLAVARDKATGWKICKSCIHDALTADCFLVTTGRSIGIRHPRPREFKGKADR